MENRYLYYKDWGRMSICVYRFVKLAGDKMVLLEVGNSNLLSSKLTFRKTPIILPSWWQLKTPKEYYGY